MDIRQLTEKEYLTVNAFIKNVMLTIFMSGNSDSAYASYIDSITNGEQLKNNINNGLWSVLGAYEGNEIIGACALDNEGTIIFLISNPKYNTYDIDSQLINYAKL